MNYCVGDYAVYKRLLHDNSVRVRWEGDSLMAIGSTASHMFLKLFPFDSLGGVGYPGAGFSQPNSAFGLSAGPYSNWVTASPTTEEKDFPEAGFGAGRCYARRLQVTFPNLTIAAGGGEPWRNGLAQMMVLIGADSGRFEWNRFEPWLKQAGASIAYDLVTYEDDVPASALYMQGRRFHGGSHLTPYMTSSAWARNVGWNLRTVSGTSVDFDGYMELGARGNTGVAVTTSNKFSIYERRIRVGTGAIISFHAKGSSDVLDWTNEAYCSPTDLAAYHALVGTTMFVRQGSGNNVPGNIGTKAAWKANTITYIEQRRAAVPGCDVILTSPIATSSGVVNALFEEFAEADEEVATLFGSGVVTGNMYAALPQYKTMYQARVGAWASGVLYPSGWVVDYSGVYYATRTAHTSSAGAPPNTNTTDYSALSGIDAANTGHYARSNVVLMDGSHPNYGSGAAAYIMAFASIAQRGAGAASSTPISYGSALNFYTGD